MPGNSPLALIVGVSGLRLSPTETAFLRDVNPFGFILFARNIETPEQVRLLTDSLREAVGRSDAPVLIDQEGGRVRRLRPPHWRNALPWGVFGRLYRENPQAGREATWLNARLIAHELHGLGIDTNCLPVLDVRSPSAHDIVGDRAFSEDPADVADLGGVVIDALLDGGVYPVVKHIPGHGRSDLDSHAALPVVDSSERDLQARDFLPFRRLNHAPFAMTAHILYQALDATRPATLSPTIVDRVIRKSCGFDGLLMTDDLSMNALSGSMEDRTRQSFDAGCDLVLHCNGVMDEMASIAGASRPLDGAGLRRWDHAKALRRAPDPAFEAEAAETRLSLLLKQAAGF